MRPPRLRAAPPSSPPERRPMRVLVLGGTCFIGRAIVEELAQAGHELTVVHRGVTEPPDLVEMAHIHAARADLPARAGELREVGPNAMVDTLAMTGADAETAVAALPPDVPVVVLSSMDVYEAYADLLAGKSDRAVPLDENSPVRTERYPFRGQGGLMDDYEKLDVEDVYLARGATVCRLPMVFGPRDGQRREEFVLRRVRAGRDRIPFGSGDWLWSRIHVADIATAVRAVVERGGLRGEVLNLNSTITLTIREWAEAILAAAGHDAELVRVPDDVLPDDLAITAHVAQQMLASNEKARSLLGWRDGDHINRIADSVRWHLAHPPENADADFSADDKALESAATG